jgi:internalin A
MMKKFELCYDIESDKEFLIPDLLPKDEPEGIEFKIVPAFQYHYPVLPSSVITRFIVRMNRYIENDIAWRSGVILKIGGNRAIVKADIEDKKLSIYIDGLEHTRRDALSAIRYELDEIHDSIKGLTPQKRIPIPEAPNAEPLEYDYLLQLERDGYDEFPVKDGNRLVKIDVRKLLSGIESESQRKESAGSVTNIYVGGDISGNFILGDDNDANIGMPNEKRNQ